MSYSHSACEAATSRDRHTQRNSRLFTLWAFLFAASLMGGHWLLTALDWRPQGPLGVVYSLAPLVPGLMAFRAYLKFFHEADELRRRIVVEGVLFAFGAVLLFWGAVQLPQHIWLPPIKADWLISGMMFGWVIGMILAARRFR